jgi:hypothetical protein
VQLEAEDANKRTPLHYACYYSSSEVVSEFCRCRADINHGDVKGRTPLHVVVCRKHRGVLFLLLSMRAISLSGSRTALISGTVLLCMLLVCNIGVLSTGFEVDASCFKLCMAYCNCMKQANGYAACYISVRRTIGLGAVLQSGKLETSARIRAALRVIQLRITTPPASATLHC